MIFKTEQFICSSCLADPGLVDFIKSRAVANECSFCPNSDNTPIVAPIHEVSDHFLDCLFTEYDIAANHLGWIGSEGGWIGNYWETYDLVWNKLELEFPQENESTLLPYLFGEYFGEHWCEASGYGLNDLETATYSWDSFCEIVKHKRRFFFMDVDADSNDPQIYNPREVLQVTLEYAKYFNLFLQLPKGSSLYRARWEGCEPHLETPQELGPPPSENATQSNRMSPAGVPMFYAGDEEETALKETASGPGCFALDRFETLRTATLLDLTAIPPVPSLFASIPDSAEIRPRRALKFLHHVARQISRPIERGDRAHVDYVPTQVFTEFVRSQVTWDGSSIDGIKYISSVHPGHASYVLFADQSNVLATSESQWSDDRWLELKETNHRRIGLCQI